MLLSKEYVASRTDNGLAETCSHQTCKTLETRAFQHTINNTKNKVENKKNKRNFKQEVIPIKT